MTGTERIQAALGVCYVGDGCNAAETEALLSTASSDAEREALRSTARGTFTRQYEAMLVAQGKKPEAVTTRDEGRVVFVKGDLCNRFLLDNFVNGNVGKVARAVGIKRLECSSKAMNAGVDL